jgi:hypothetical protein
MIWHFFQGEKLLSSKESEGLGMHIDGYSESSH